MKITNGYLYFISDEFFQKVNDPYLKINYEKTSRPHYLAVKDSDTGLNWVVPCSSKIEKYENIIEQKKALHKPTDTLKIVTIQGRKSALLFQDMFPIIEKYIQSSYILAGIPVSISNEKIISVFEKNAKHVINLLHRGVRFTPTQPDANRIEKLMLEELAKDKNINIVTSDKPSVLQKLNLAKEKSVSLPELRPDKTKNIEDTKER